MYKFPESWIVLSLVAAFAAATQAVAEVSVKSADSKTTVSIEARERWESRSNADFSPPLADHRTDLFTRVRLNIKHTTDNATVFFQPQFSYDKARLSGSSSTDSWLRVHQLYVDVPKMSSQLSARMGRQELTYGDQRLVGNFNWSNVGRSFDGARVSVDLRTSRLDLFGAQLGDALPRPSLPWLWGAYWSASVQKPGNTTDGYLLHKRDSKAGDVRVYTPGVRLRRAFERWDTGAEGAYQFGDVGARSVRAWAWHADASYKLNRKWTAMIEANEASGGDPTGTGRYRTFDQLYPTNHDKYGIMDNQGWRNMRNLRAGLRYAPAPGWSFGADIHSFRLQNARDYWYGASGRPNVGPSGVLLRDPTGAAGKDVGRELDIYGRRALSKTASVEGGYAIFWPGDFVKQVAGSSSPGGATGRSEWFYLQATALF